MATMIIGASGNNLGTDGMAGVAWDVRLMSVKVLDDNGSGDDASVLGGIAYAIHYNEDPGHIVKVRVISLSLGSMQYNQALAFDDAYQYARSKGIVVAVAAGNDSGEVTSSANVRYCLAVSSSSVYKVGAHSWELLSGFSNRGDRIDVAAPGGDIYSTLPATSSMGANHGYESGTSMATPFVAGLAALIVAKNDPGNLQLNAAFVDKVMQHIEGTADDLGAPGKDPQFGYGRVNVLKAMTATTFPAALPN